MIYSTYIARVLPEVQWHYTIKIRGTAQKYARRKTNFHICVFGYFVKEATQYTKRGLSLEHNRTYYVSIRAFNAAGLNTTVAAAGLTIDTTAPLTSRVRVSDMFGGRSVSFMSSSKPLAAHWEGITDPESGVANSKYCLGNYWAMILFH